MQPMSSGKQSSDFRNLAAAYGTTTKSVPTFSSKLFPVLNRSGTQSCWERITSTMSLKLASVEARQKIVLFCLSCVIFPDFALF